MRSVSVLTQRSQNPCIRTDPEIGELRLSGLRYSVHSDKAAMSEVIK